MKRRLSFIIALMLTLNLFAGFTVASAAEGSLLSGGYEFTDTAYSEELGIYLAVAKDFSASANGNPLPARVYKSTDGENWNVAFNSSSSAYLNANRKSRQSLLWWPAAQLFVLGTGDNIYTSPDGETWSPKKIDNANQGILRGNAMIEASGNVLVVSGGRAVKFATPETVHDTQVAHHIFDPSNASTSTIAVGVSTPNADGKQTFVSVSSGAYWLYNGEYETSTANGNLKNVSKVTNNFTGADTFAYDMVYEQNTRSWLIVNGTNRLFVLSEAQDYINFSVNGENSITAAGADDETAIIGTAEGKLYYTDSTGGVNANSVWTEIECGMGTLNDEVRSISSVGEDSFIMVSKSKIYFIEKQNDTFAYFDITAAGINMTAGEERIEVPVEGEVTCEYKFAYQNFRGKFIEGRIDSVELSSAPDGVSFDGSTLAVDSSCKGGEAVFSIHISGGATEQRTITIVDEKRIVFEGASGFVIPAKNTQHVISAYVEGTDGTRLEREIALTAVSLPDGVEFDSETNTLTISAKSEAGAIVLNAVMVSDPTLCLEKEFDLDEPYVKEIKITSGDDSIVISDEKATMHTYIAQVHNQADEVMTGAGIAWSVENPGNLGSITIKDGILTVPSDAYAGEITVTASTTVGDKVLSDSKKVTLTISYFRYTVEDIKELSKINFANLTDNVTLPVKGSWGCTIAWRSTDDSVVTSDGVITKNNKKVNTAKLVATVTYKIDDANSVSNSASFPVTIAINDNIYQNGDVETGKTDGFLSEGAIEVITEPVNGGSYALKSDGKAVEIPVAVPTDSLEEESSYYIEAYVSAPEAKKITLKSDQYGELNEVEAKDGYVKITGFIRTTKAKKDSVTISVNNQTAFTVDDVRGFDITQEYSEVASAVSGAEYAKTKAKYNTAKELVNAFYDCPERDNLLARLSKIKIGSSSSSGSGGSVSASVSSGTHIDTIAETVPADEREHTVEYQNLMFKDMDGHWAKTEVEAMGAAGVVSGRADGVFDPDASITRAEFAVLITKTTGITEEEYENVFFDVVSEDWYSGYVQAARNAGYLTGSDGLFKPNSNITREEMARIVVSAYAAKKNAQIEQGGALYYSDLPEISAWAYDYIVNAVNLELMMGVSEYTFAPKATATRAQAAVILKRLLDKLA